MLCKAACKAYERELLPPLVDLLGEGEKQKSVELNSPPTRDVFSPETWTYVHTRAHPTHPHNVKWLKNKSSRELCVSFLGTFSLLLALLGLAVKVEAYYCFDFGGTLRNHHHPNLISGVASGQYE